MPSPILPWVKKPSSSGPRWAITSHIRRRTPESTRASAPNSSIPAIPHISFFTPINFHSHVATQGTKSRNSKSVITESSSTVPSERNDFFDPGWLNHSRRLGNQAFAAPLAETARNIITCVNRPCSSLRWNDFESLAPGPRTPISYFNVPQGRILGLREDSGK